MAAERVRLGATELEVHRRGAGTPLVLLHGDDGLLFTEPLVERLAERFEVVAPVLPGWHGSPRPAHVTTVTDLAYTCLDLIESLDGPVLLAGASIGAWVAAEAAVTAPRRLGALALVAPVGMKVGGREDRAFVDLYATPADEARAALYGDPVRMPDLSRLDGDQLLALTQAQEAVARYAWEPYFHNPKLPHRLRRIDVPALVVVGSEERFVLEDGYAEAWAEAIGSGAEVAVIEGAGHRVEEEAPAELAELLAGLADRMAWRDGAGGPDETDPRTVQVAGGGER